MLSALASAPGRMFSREELWKEVYGGTQPRGSRAPDVQVHRLGQRLTTAGAGSALMNVRGRGYTVTEEGRGA